MLIGMGGPGKRNTHRNPLLLFRFVGWLLFRFAARKLSGLLLFQEPPRTTRACASQPARGYHGLRRMDRKPYGLDTKRAHIVILPSLRRCAPAAVHGELRGHPCPRWKGEKG